AKGVVHRDIKPQNIVICTDGTAKLLDFGIAVQKGGTQLTREGLVPGTVSYMAPEVFQGEKPDHRADIYALGQVLWEALTGKEAYPEDADTTPGQSVVQMMGKKLSSEPLDPGDEFTPALRDLVKDCTNPEPDDRLPELTNFVVILKSETTGDALKGLAPAPRRKKKASKPKKGGSSSLGLIVAALISVLLVGVAVVVIGALGGFAFIGLIMAQAMFTMSDTGTWQQPSAYEAPAYGGWAMPEQSIPEGFPFEVTDDAKIISGMATESMGMTTYIVTYTTGSDPAKIIADYDKTFKSRGLTTTTATTSDQNGVTHVVSAYSPSGSDGMATASASPNYMGPGYMVSVTWTPTSGGY
ncbi:MAG: serine/threonine protein kinase, partial [Proteobacteria bacterium]|nr:serine/threonine protein kinase [Pseudomonadota bacterium]